MRELDGHARRGFGKPLAITADSTGLDVAIIKQGTFKLSAVPMF